VKHTPANPDLSPADVAFKVNSQGNAVPKNPAGVNNPFTGVNPGKAAQYRNRCMEVCHNSIP
jgi:hypothetical protein